MPVLAHIYTDCCQLADQRLTFLTFVSASKYLLAGVNLPLVGGQTRRLAGVMVTVRNFQPASSDSGF